MFRASPRSSGEAFFAHFDALADGVRGRLRLRVVLDGVTLGALGAVPVATALWLSGHDAWIPASLALPLAGVAAGLAVDRARRWSDESVALYLDARCQSPETVTTALGLRHEPTSPLREHVLAAGVRVLRAAGDASPGVTTRRHVLAPVALFVLLGVSAVRSFSTPANAATPASVVLDVVRLDDVPGLRAIERLRDLHPEDPQRRAQLQALAEQARQLREDLRRGLDRREADRRLHALQEQLRQNADPLGRREERPGLDAAFQELSRRGFPEAAEALADHDLRALDETMERAANAREEADRQRAHEALQAAADAAAQQGATAAAEALRDEDDLLHQRAQRNRLMREMAQQLGRDEAVRHAAEHLDRNPSEQSARDLADALERALSQLSTAERERLMARIRDAARRPQQASRAGSMDPHANPSSEHEMSAEELAQRLREIANQDPSGEGEDGEPSDGAQMSSGGGGSIPFPVASPGGRGMAMQRAMQRAQDAAAQAQRQAGGGAPGGNAQAGAGNGQDGNGPGGDPNGQGGGRGGGPGGAHAGETDRVRRESDLQARVRGPMQAGAPMPGGTSMLGTGTPGGVSRVMRSGALERAATDELQGVDRSDIPTDYRAQVRTYFQP